MVSCIANAPMYNNRQHCELLMTHVEIRLIVYVSSLRGILVTKRNLRLRVSVSLFGSNFSSVE